MTGESTNAAFSISLNGTPPFGYLWQMNGTNLPGRTGSTLTVSNVQVSSEGIYSVVATNAYGATRASARLTVIPAGPTIWIQPTNQNTVLRGSCSFGVTARGTEPLACQWLFNSNPLPGATNSTLLLTNVQTNNLGNYSVVVSNTYGSVTSSNATIVVVPSMLIAWGMNIFGECNILSSLTNVSAFAGGWGYSAAANSNGAASTWGFHEPAFSPSPTNVSAIAAGGTFVLALKTDGTIAAAGTTVPVGLSTVVAIAAGDNSSLALRRDGSVVAWGSGSSSNVPAGVSNVVAITCGWLHDLALKNDGTVVAWGDNGFGQTNVPPGLSNVVAIGAGWYHSLAVKGDGTVVAWGYNGSGQTEVPPGLSNVVAVAGGNQHSMALRSDGSIIAWGRGVEGETNIPPQAINGIAIASGDEHCLALLGDGSPRIVNPLRSQSLSAGGTTILNAGIVGAAPMFYQWQLNGTNISGATNALLELSNIPLTGAGNYTCFANNALGSITTSNAGVVVMRQPLRFDVGGDLPVLHVDGFHLRLLNLAGVGNVTIQASDDLVSWQTVLIYPPTVGALDFTDANVANHSRRFYRASEGGAFSIGPLRFENAVFDNGNLNLHLTGLSGHGPVILYGSSNLLIWDPLLTNPPAVGALELLDTSASNQPVRFYRALEQ